MRHFATIRRGLKVHPRLWILTTLALLVFSSFCLSPYALTLEQKTGLRWLFLWRGPVKPPTDVVIVALSSAAGEQLALPRQSSAWPRTVHAQLIQQLHNAGARLMVMDIAFKDARDEQEDAALEQAIAQAQRVVLFKYLRRHQIDAGAGRVDIEEEISPLPRFAQHAIAIGSFVLPKYPAEVSHAYLFTELSRGREATQPLQAFEALDSDRSASFSSGDLPNPITINFYGPAETLTTIPIDIALRMSATEARAIFANKVVYIGYSDRRQTEQQDAYRTVFSDRHGIDISGVEISATVFANLLQKNYLRSPAPAVIVFICLFVFAATILSHRLRLTHTVIAQILAGSIYAGSAYWLFQLHYFWSPLLLPLLALAGGNTVMWAWHHLQQKKREEEIRYTLTQYLPTEAAQKLSRNFNKLEQQRQLVQGVCLLTDIQGYTRLAETLPPTELHSLMNRYYAVLIKAVENNGGFIGNLVGDGMLALWTAAEISPTICNPALQTVTDIQTRLQQESDLYHQLPTCFGLHGGQFSLGNLGHTGHFEYSPVGDMINTAARIEHLTRQLGTQILCSAPVAEHLHKEMRFLGSFSLRNKAIPVALYTPADLSPALLAEYKQAYEYFENKRYGEALRYFARLADGHADGPSIYFANACRQELKLNE